MVRHRITVREFLDLYMNRAKLTDLELGLRLGYTTNSPVSMVRRGERDIPEGKIPEWADALRLFGKDREEFTELCHLHLATSWLQQQFYRLKGKQELAEKMAQDALAEVQALRHELAEYRRSKEKS